MRFGRSPTARVLPIAMIGISARPAGSSRIKLHRLPACEEGGRDVAYCDPERASPWLSICTASHGWTLLDHLVGDCESIRPGRRCAHLMNEPACPTRAWSLSRRSSVAAD